MQTFKKSEVRALVQIMSSIKLERMTSEVKVPITRNFVRLRTVVKELEEMQKEISDKLVTDEFRELSENKARTPEEETYFNELVESINAEYAEVIDPILNETCDIDIQHLTEAQFDSLIEKSDFELGIAGIVHDNFVANVATK